MPDTEATSELPSLSVVIPAYDELPNLRELLPVLGATLAGVPGLTSEIIAVLPRHAGPEEAAEIERLGARAIVRGPTDCFGDAIRSGLAATSATSRYVVTMDADGSHDPATIPRMLAARDGSHVVVASRYTEGGVTDNSLVLKWMSRALNLAYGYILGIECHDISTNYKLYRCDDVANVTLSCADFDVVEELLFRIKQRHGDAFVVTEVPDHFLARRHGETKRSLGPFILSYLSTLLRLRWQAERGRR